MSDVKERATEQATRHLLEFLEDCDWDEMLEKYAEVSNKSDRERDEFLDRYERGAKIDQSDLADMYYYSFYCDGLAKKIADKNLVTAGYERDKKGHWILKSEPTPPKKKRGFWR